MEHDTMATLTTVGGSSQKVKSGQTISDAVRSNLEANFNASTSIALANDRVVTQDYVIQPGDDICLNPKIVNG
jgi:sulfur carrier protein ThiS